MPQTLIRIKAQDETAEGIGSVDNRLQGLLTQGSSVGTGLSSGLALAGGAITAVGAGVIALTAAYSDNVTQLVRTSQQSGVTVRSLSELQFAFRDAGLEAEDLDDTVFELNLKMGEAREGSEDVANAFQKVGIAFGELGRLGADDALLRIADGLSRMTSDSERALVAGQLFGDDIARRLLPLLSQGSEAFVEAARGSRGVWASARRSRSGEGRAV